MSFKVFTPVVLLAAIILAGAGKLGATHVDTADFTLVKRSDGISLYERWYPIDSDQNAREVKATFLVKTDPTSALALLRDKEKGALWNKNTNAFDVVDIDEDTWVCYIQYDLPWPVNNQDCVLKYSAAGEPDSLVVDFFAVDHPKFPMRSRIQRIPDTRGKWLFRKTAEGIEVEYYITTRPSKTLPNWLTDPIIRNNLIATVGAFKELLETKL